jgi:hypothetical protein
MTYWNWNRIFIIEPLLSNYENYFLHIHKKTVDQGDKNGGYGVSLA